jgi:hypothetical protein
MSLWASGRVRERARLRSPVRWKPFTRIAPFKLLLLDHPAPGAAFVSVCPMGEQVFLSLAFYLYGKDAADVAKKNEPVWKAWMNEHFGAAAPAISA